MAYLAQTNKEDDQTEQTGVINPNQPAGRPVTISSGPQDIYSAGGTDSTASPGGDSSSNPNATKGTGFTNIQRYLNANQPGAINLGNRVSSSISDQVKIADNAIASVESFANANPEADIYNSQPDINAQQAITNANQKAALSGNIAGQSQLIRNISSPNLSSGGVNLNQFLMQQGQGYGNVANAAKNAAGLQGKYGSRSANLQDNSTTLQALRKLQKQVKDTNSAKPVTITTPSTKQVPNTSDIRPNGDTGATVTNPYAGLSPEQIAYLHSLQQTVVGPGSGGTTPGTTPGTTLVPGVNADGTLNRAPVTRTATLDNTGVTFGHGGATEGSAWSALSPSEQASYYANNPTMSDVTQALQKAWGYTLEGKLAEAAQNKLVPGFVDDQKTIAKGVDPAALAMDQAVQAAQLAGPTEAERDATAQQALAQVVAEQQAQAQYQAQLQAQNEAQAQAQYQAQLQAQNEAQAQINADAQAAQQAQIQAMQQAEAEAAQAAQQASYAPSLAYNLFNPADANFVGPVDTAALDKAIADAIAAYNSAPAHNYSLPYDPYNPYDANFVGPPGESGGGSYGNGYIGSGGHGGSYSGTTYGGAASAEGGGYSGGYGGYAKDGGYMSGPGTSRSDSIPIHVSNGEYVINAKVVKALGKEFFDRLNNSVK